MKALIFILTILATTAASAYTCQRTVNPSAVVLFVDMRDSRGEVEAAARAACNRGETFKRLGGNNLTATNIQREFAALARSNKAITSMVVSGHDGGGSIHGSHPNNIDKEEIISGMKDAYRGKAGLLNQFQSLHLWGCWTNGPGEVAAIRAGLPSLKVISGFIDMAPLNTTEATRTILSDLLEKERSLLASANRNELRRGLSAIENINVTYAAVYIEACGENLYYYNKDRSTATEHGTYDNHSIITPDPNFTPGTHFVNFDASFSCARPPRDLEQKKALILDYYQGRRPIPANTANGPLRQLYAYARNNARCLGRIPQFNGDRLLMLTFYENIKKNFAQKYALDISQANTEYSRLMREMRGGLNQWDLPVMSSLNTYMQAGHNKVFLPNAATLAGKSRLQIRQMIAHLDGIQKHPAMRVPGVARRFERLKNLQNKMETYLYQLNPNCMDFMSWHEFTPGGYASTSCDR